MQWRSRREYCAVTTHDLKPERPRISISSILALPSNPPRPIKSTYRSGSVLNGTLPSFLPDLSVCQCVTADTKHREGVLINQIRS